MSTGLNGGFFTSTSKIDIYFRPLYNRRGPSFPSIRGPLLTWSLAKPRTNRGLSVFTGRSRDRPRLPERAMSSSSTELKLATGDLTDTVFAGFYVFDPRSDPKQPLAPQSHYEHLARTIIAYVRAFPPEHTDVCMRYLSQMLKFCDEAVFRRMNE